MFNGLSVYSRNGSLVDVIVVLFWVAFEEIMLE